MASKGHFKYRCVRWRDLPGPPAGKWPPEATSRTDYMLAGPPSATCWDTASGGHFSYRFVRWRDLPGPPAGKWPPVPCCISTTSLLPRLILYVKTQWCAHLGRCPFRPWFSQGVHTTVFSRIKCTFLVASQLLLCCQSSFYT